MDLGGHRGYCGGWKNVAVNLCQGRMRTEKRSSAKWVCDQRLPSASRLQHVQSSTSLITEQTQSLSFEFFPFLREKNCSSFDLSTGMIENKFSKVILNRGGRSLSGWPFRDLSTSQCTLVCCLMNSFTGMVFGISHDLRLNEL